MKCQDAEEEILNLADHSRLSPELTAHLAQCAPCSALLAESEEVDLLFGTAPVLEPNPFLWTRIESRLAREKPPGARRWGFALPASTWLAAAALVLLSVLIVSFQSEIPLNPDLALAEYAGLQSTDGGNPFLIAQARGASGINPFLEAMMPRNVNPFRFQREP
ncbi:MAG: hypothetical protein HY315_01575 [Acidobacteria bacterium]|nr:hypothetical protein [Acidobacteriota bacterium]